MRFLIGHTSKYNLKIEPESQVDKDYDVWKIIKSDSP